MKEINKIHLKIEAKGKVNMIELYKHNSDDFTRIELYKLIINTVALNDLFILPYKVQKLSKKARRNQI